MLDMQDLQAIAQIMDEKLKQQKVEILDETKQMMTQQKTEILDETTKMMDAKLKQQKIEILGETKQMMKQQKLEILDETTQMMDAKLKQQKNEILDEATHRMKVLLDTEVTVKFNLMAEAHEVILERLVSRARVEALEGDVKVLKALFKQMNEDVERLKKAN